MAALYGRANIGLHLGSIKTNKDPLIFCCMASSPVRETAPAVNLPCGLLPMKTKRLGYGSNRPIISLTARICFPSRPR